MLALYSPWTVKISLPTAFRMPQDFTCSSMTGSNSSNMYSRSTLAANSSISFLGRGCTRPSFSTLASGMASRTYWYGIPLVMKPTDKSLYSARFMGRVQASSASFFIRFSTTRWRLMAFPGIMTYFAILRS